mgnify:CR=1 FL=1
MQADLEAINQEIQNLNVTHFQYIRGNLSILRTQLETFHDDTMNTQVFFLHCFNFRFSFFKNKKKKKKNH